MKGEKVYEKGVNEVLYQSLMNPLKHYMKNINLPPENF